MLAIGRELIETIQCYQSFRGILKMQRWNLDVCFFFTQAEFRLSRLSKSLHLLCFWRAVIFCGDVLLLGLLWACCFLQTSCAWMVHTAFETVSPQVAMLSPAFYQWFMWFMCKLLKIPVLVEDKAPEVCFLSVDMSGFECLIQLMNCKMKVFVPGVHWGWHWGVNHIISLSMKCKTVKSIPNKGYFRQKIFTTTL